MSNAPMFIAPPAQTEGTPTEQQAATPAPAPADPAPATETEPDWKAEAEKWKALSRQHEERSKANADKAKRFDELEEASKSELQKAQERAEKAERELAETALKAMRAEIAAEKGVPAGLLSGATEEELRAAADALLAFRGETPKVPSATGLGTVGTPIPSGTAQVTREELAGKSAAWINQARAEGRLVDLGFPPAT